MSRKFIFVFIFILLALAALSCNLGSTANASADYQELLAQIPKHYSGDPQADKTFVGSLEGTQTYIAFVIQNDKAIVYICDGYQVSEWITGKVADGKLDLTTDKGTHLTASATSDSVTGTLTLTDGQPLVFSASPTVEGQTGLYRYQGDENGITYTTGWIVGPSGARGETNSVNGAQNGVVVDITPGAEAQTALRLLSDSNEYTIAFQGVGYNLHALSVLQIPVNPGQNDFDYFCNGNKYFAGGIVVPENSILTVSLVADGCQAVNAGAQASVSSSSGTGSSGSASDGSAASNGNNGSSNSGVGSCSGFNATFCFQPGLGGFGFGGQFGNGFGGSQFGGGGFGGFGGFNSGFGP